MEGICMPQTKERVTIEMVWNLLQEQSRQIQAMRHQLLEMEGRRSSNQKMPNEETKDELYRAIDKGLEQVKNGEWCTEEELDAALDEALV
jgi:hypothetical protein